MIKYILNSIGVLILMLAFSACSKDTGKSDTGSDGETETGSESETTVDTGSDSETETGSDSETTVDTGSDSETETGSDSETTVDTGSDSETETGSDSETLIDTALDSESDSDSEICIGNYDPETSCTSCINNYYGTDCLACSEGYDATLGCGDCSGNKISDQGTCDACLVYFTGSSCTCMWSGSNGSLAAIAPISDTELVAVGRNGVIMHYDNSGWQVMNSNTAMGLNDVWAFSSDDIFAVGDYGTIRHFDGVSWSAMETIIPDTYYSLKAIWAADRKNIFIADTNGDVYFFNADLCKWEKMILPPDADEKYFTSIWGAAADNVYVAGYSTKTLETFMFHYDGESWEKLDGIPSKIITSIDGADAQNIYVTTHYLTSEVYHFDGTTWTQIGSHATHPFTSVTALSANEVYVAAGEGGVYRWYGSSWEQQDGGNVSQVKNVNGKIWALSGSPQVASSTGNGVWESDESGNPSAPWFEDVWVNPITDEAFACGMKSGDAKPGKLYSFDGKKWSQIIEADYALYGVFGLNTDSIGTADVYVSGEGVIYKLDGNSLVAETIPSGLEKTIFMALSAKSDGAKPHIYAAGYDYSTNMAVIMEKTDSAWAITKNDTSGMFTDVWTSYMNDALVTGWDESGNGVIWRQKNGESDWTVEPTGQIDKLYGIDGMTSNNITAAGSNGTVLKYNGMSWNKDNVDSYFSTTSFKGVYKYQIAPAKDIAATWMSADSTWGKGARIPSNGTGIFGSNNQNVFMTGSNGMILHYTCE